MVTYSALYLSDAEEMEKILDEKNIYYISEEKDMEVFFVTEISIHEKDLEKLDNETKKLFHQPN